MHLSEKTIKGRKYLYAVKSFRLPGGRIKKIAKLIKDKNKFKKNELEDYFNEKEKEIVIASALRNFRTDGIFTESEIAKMEEIKLNYKKLRRKLDKADWRDVLDRFTSNFTFNSNAIEGNSLTLKDVEIVIFEDRIPKGKELREIYETRNSRIVIEEIFGRKIRVSHKNIIKMHSLLMKDIDERIGYKKMPNILIGRITRTTPPEGVEEEMGKLIDFINKNPERMPPLHLAAVSHGRFEKIHPFADGNGRVGRFLINVILVNNGYPPLIIRNTQRNAYLKDLEDYDNGYKTNLERFILEKYKDTYRKFFEVYVKYLH